MNRLNTFYAATAFALVASLGTDTSAQNRNCAIHDTVVERLADAYGESRTAIAMNSDTSVLEIFASDETGTWTITVTKAGGLTCIVAAGDNYQHVGEVLPSTDDDA